MLSEIERNPRLESRWLQPNPTYQNYVLPEISVGLEPVTPDIINHFLQCLELLDPSSPQSIELLNQILLGIIHHGIHFKSVIAPPHIYKMINCLKNESLRDATIQVILQLVFLLPKEVTNVLVQENILIFFKDILTAGCCCQTEEAILLIFNYVNIDNCDYLINISFFQILSQYCSSNRNNFTPLCLQIIKSCKVTNNLIHSTADMVFQVVFSGDLGNMILALIILMSFIPGENEEIEDNDYILEITIEKDFDLFLAQYLDKDQTSLVVQIISFYTKLAYYGNPTIKRFIESGIVSASILNFQRNCEVLSREIFNFLKVLTISADDVFEPLVNVIFSFDFADIAEVTPFFIREKIVKFVLHMASISGPFFTKMILSPKMIDFLIQFSECCDSSKQEKIILCLSNILRGSGDPEFVQMVVLKWDESVSLTCICPDLLNPEIVL